MQNHLNAAGESPHLTMFDALSAILRGYYPTPTLFIRISGAYRTIIQSEMDHPFNSPHQFVFDDHLQLGRAEVRDASTGTIWATVDNLAIPSAVANWEEVNA